MPTTIDALEEVVTRHGRAALDDPITLTGALRSLTDPPPEDDVSALAAAAGAGAPARIRAAVEQGRTPEQALDDVAPASAEDRTRWACAQLGAALGLLPRSLAADPGRASSPTTPVTVAADGTATDDDTTAVVAVGADGATGRPRRRRAALAGGAAALVLAAAVGAGLLLTRGGSTGEAAGTTPAATAPAATPAPTAPAPTTQAPPSDPRAAFTDPVLRATAEPYLQQPGTTCERDPEPIAVLRESVTCALGTGGAAGVFTRYFDPANVVALRDLTGSDETAVPGSRRTLRWEYVAGRPGVRSGIPVGSGRPGDGTRIRWTGLDSRSELLYFDEDATGVAVQLGLLGGGDREQLRRLWADPNG